MGKERTGRSREKNKGKGWKLSFFFLTRPSLRNPRIESLEPTTFGGWKLVVFPILLYKIFQNDIFV